jgi:hypothetical protein
MLRGSYTPRYFSQQTTWLKEIGKATKEVISFYRDEFNILLCHAC